MANSPLSRRSFIKQAPLAVVAASILPLSGNYSSTRERLDAAIAELQSATEAHMGGTGEWVIAVNEHRDNGASPIVIAAKDWRNVTEELELPNDRNRPWLAA